MPSEPVPSPYDIYPAPICFTLQTPLAMDTVYSPANRRLRPRVGDLVLGDLLPDKNPTDPEAIVLSNDLRRTIEHLLSTLKERERLVLLLRFGLADGQPRTLETIGKNFGLTRERVRQIEARALNKLRRPSTLKLLEPFRYNDPGRPRSHTWPPEHHAPPQPHPQPHTPRTSPRLAPPTQPAPLPASHPPNKLNAPRPTPPPPNPPPPPTTPAHQSPTQPEPHPSPGPLPMPPREQPTLQLPLPTDPRDRFLAEVQTRGYHVLDNRRKGGSLWIHDPSRSLANHIRQLAAQGFTFRFANHRRANKAGWYLTQAPPETLRRPFLPAEAPQSAQRPRAHLDSSQMSAASPADIERYRRNLRDEVDGIALYRALAAAEKDPHLRQVFQRLAESEERHRALWEEKLRQAGAKVPHYKPSWRVRLLAWLARRFGTASVSPIVTRMEMSAYTMYDDQPEAIAADLPRDERSHARLFRELARSTRSRQIQVDIARLEGRHRAGTGNALRAAVLGANDGLVSNLSLVMGVAGANPGRDVVILAGVAGLLAGSLSMALGEWISVRSSAEAFSRQLEIERDELSLMPDEELEELVLIYRAKGLPEEEARIFAQRILANHEQALDTLAREELGMSEEEAGNAWVAAITSFLTFSFGAVIPVIPWLAFTGTSGIAASTIASALGLFGVGAAITLYTGRSVLFSGFRMLTFGLAASAITFGIGKLIGVSTGI